MCIDELIKDEELKANKPIPLDLDNMDKRSMTFTEKARKKVSALQSPQSKFTSSSLAASSPSQEKEKPINKQIASYEQPRKVAFTFTKK